MQISLKYTFATEVNLKRKKSKKAKVDKKFDLDFKVIVSDNEKREYYIIFDLLLTDSQNFSLKIEYVAGFSTDEDIDSSFEDSNFAVINSPAIAYPYLRSLVSLIALNSGYGSIYMPAINFIELNKDKKRAKDTTQI